MSEEQDREIGEMDRLLQGAARGFAYPPTPALAAAVGTRLHQDAPPPGHAFDKRLPGWPRGWGALPAVRIVAAALALVLAAVGIALAVPQSRSALAEFFGLSHVQVRTVPIPFAAETPPVLREESFADATTLEAAEKLVDFRLRFPTYPLGVGEPDAVYLQLFREDVVIIFVYEQAGFALHQSRLRGSFVKGVPEGIVQVEVAGSPALWVPQGGHGAAYLDPNGEEIPRSARAVERATLLWEEDGITHRLETSLPKDEAIKVAESLR